MRIFLSCQQALRPHAVPAYAFWEYYIQQGLAEAGHEVVAAPGVDWAEGLSAMTESDRAAWRERTWSRTLDFLRAEHARRPVALFLSYLFPQQVQPEAVAEINACGIPTVNFFCDNIREFAYVPDAFRPFALHWVPEADARALYIAARLKYIYAPMPMWVAPELRQPAAAENESVVFIGTHDALREELLGRAVADGLPLRIFGAGWLQGPAGAPAPTAPPSRLSNQWEFLRRHGVRGLANRASYQFRKHQPTDWIPAHAEATLAPRDYIKVTRESRIVLGVNRCPSFRRSFGNPLRYSRLRDLEAPMLGACLLTELAPGLEDLYELGAEIETYRNAAELVVKAAELAADPARRAALRRRGQHRALANHTVGRTIERIALELGLAN